MAWAPRAILRVDFLLIAGSLVIAGSPAGASPLYAKFYSGGPGYTGPYNGASTVYGQTAGAATLSPSGSTVNGNGSDKLGSTLTFSGGITATANPNNMVWDDLTPNYGGLGTGLFTQGGDTDQIAGSEFLNLTFSKQVKLEGVGTLFGTGHAPFGSNFPSVASVASAQNTITFLLSVDGSAFQAVKFLDANNIALALIGTSFRFEENTANNPEFYVGAVAYNYTTPLPAALPLMGSVLGAGYLVSMWRRRRSSDGSELNLT
jgi:hypothetical protein